MDFDNANDGRSRLAQELLDSILDHLHNDLGSLKRSALASKSLLPTCQRHLFSTFKITESNKDKVSKLFALPPSTNEHDKDASLPARLEGMLNAYTTDLILENLPEIVSGTIRWETHLPEFKNVKRIIFKGINFEKAAVIPSFLERTCFSPSSRLQSVEFDFRQTYEKAILESFCLLPPTVEDIAFTSIRGTYGGSDWDAASVRNDTRHRLLRMHGRRPGVRHFNGTLKLRLGPSHSHRWFLSTMLELDDQFKFRLKHINYALNDRASIRHFAPLVDECKDTLQSLDILVSVPGAHKV